MRRKGAFVVTAICFVSAAAGAQQTPPPTQTPPPPAVQPYRGRVLGVYDASTGDPIEGAQVTDVATGTFSLTTKTGTVSLIFIPDGGGMVRIRKIGFAPWSEFVAISPRDTAPLTIVLAPTVPVLPTVVTTDTAPHYISGRLRAFEERRKTGFGHYIAEAELRKNDNREMPDVLRRIPGVTVTCSTRTPRVCTATSSRTAGSRCSYVIYVDGVQSPEKNLLMLPVNQFAGVEVYSGPGQIPAEYNMTGSSCGVLLLWTRER
jgi:hypothetical protein